MKELKTFTTGKGTYDSFPDKTARAELPKKLTRPATARVGDYLRIKAIGADGTMEVEAAPAPEGGNKENAAYPDWSHLKWYVLGDSLTDPAGGVHTSKFYYEYIAEKTGIQVIVDGMGGTGYYAGASTNRRFADRVPNIPADVDIVTIFGSGNDIRHGYDNYKSAMSDALKIFYLERPGLPVIVVPPTPWKGYSKRGEEWKGYCDTLALMALNYNARYVSDMFDCPPFDPNSAVDLDSFFTKDIVDGVHPDENGHEAIARYVYNAMLQELEFENGYPRGGADGDGQNPSQDGFSPIATVTQTADGATITITDKNGTTTATVTNGKDYELTDDDRQEIAEQAAAMVPGGGGGARLVSSITVADEVSAISLPLPADDDWWIGSHKYTLMVAGTIGATAPDLITLSPNSTADFGSSGVMRMLSVKANADQTFMVVAEIYKMGKNSYSKAHLAQPYSNNEYPRAMSWNVANDPGSLKSLHFVFQTEGATMLNTTVELWEVF